MTTSRAVRASWSLRVVLAVAASGLVGVVGVPPAAAHGGGASIEIGQAEDVGPLEIEFPIRLTYDSDGHDVEGIDGLRVVAMDVEGEAAQEWTDPFTPGDAPGVFVVRLELDEPGDYDLQITIDDPESSGALLVSVPEADVETDPEPVPDESEPGDEPAPVAPNEESETTVEDQDGENDDGDALVWILVGVGLLVGIGIGVVAARSFRRDPPQD